MDKKRQDPPSARELMEVAYAKAPITADGARYLPEGRDNHWLVMLPDARDPELFVAGPAGIEAMLSEYFHPAAEGRVQSHASIKDQITELRERIAALEARDNN